MPFMGLLTLPLTFLTKDTNLTISDRLPEAYFAEVEDRHPGALASPLTPVPNWRLIRPYFCYECQQALDNS